MAKPVVECCQLHSAHGAARLHWFHADDCPLTPGREVEVVTASSYAGKRRLIVVGGVDWGKSTEDVPTRLDPSTAHPACIAAAADGATPCSRCSWLLDRDDEGARYIDFHLDGAR